MKVLLTLIVMCSLLYVAASDCAKDVSMFPKFNISVPGHMQDIAYDPDDNKVYVAYWGNSVVDIFNRDGSKDGTIDLEFDIWFTLTSIDVHKGVLYASANNQLYVRSFNTHADFWTPKLSTVFGPFDGSGNSNIIVNDNGVYVVNYIQNAVIQYDFSGQEIKRFTTSELQYPQDAAFDSKGNLHVTSANNYKVFVLDASGNKVSSYHYWLNNEPRGIFIDSLDNSFVCTRQHVAIFDTNGYYNRGIWTFPNIPTEVILLPDCEVWAASGKNNVINVFKK